MSDERNEHDEDEGLSALSALVRTSVPPNTDADDEEDEDDGKLDLAALAASIAPPAPDDSVGDDDEDEDEAEAHAAPAASPDDDDAEEAAPAAASAVADAPKPKAKAKAKAKKKGKSKKKAAAPAPQPEPERAVAAAAPAEVAQPSKSGNGMWIGIAIGGAVAAAAIFFVMNKNEGDTAADTIASAPTSVSPGDEEPGLGTVGAADPAPSQGPSAGVDDMNPAGEGGEPGVDAEGDLDVEGGELEAGDEGASPIAAGAPSRRRRRRAAGAAAPSAAGTQEAAPGAQPDPPSGTQPATPAGGRRGGSQQEAATGGQMDNLLDQALGGRPNRSGTGTTGQAARQQPAAAETPPSRGSLPPQPSRQNIARTLGGLMSRIRACAADQRGMALSTIMIRNDGSVASVSIGGNPFGGSPQGSCMEGVIRGARFEAFSQSTARISYPFNIR